jgi:hypothetical protein
MGEPLEWDELPGAELEDYFKPVRISPRAIDHVSKIVPAQHWIEEGP